MKKFYPKYIRLDRLEVERKLAYIMAGSKVDAKIVVTFLELIGIELDLEWMDKLTEEYKIKLERSMSKDESTDFGDHNQCGEVKEK